jgi:hypothetical protein
MASARQRASKAAFRARHHGLGDHVRSTLPESAWIGLQGASIAVLGGVFVTDTLGRVAAIAIGVGLIAVAVGVARAAEWARWAGGTASLLLAAGAVADPYLLRADGEEARIPKYLLVILALTTGACLLSPSTREYFRDAPEDRSRVRETKRAA